MSFPIHGFERYQNGFMSTVDAGVIKKAAFKLVLDYSYGSSSRIFPSILGALNCDVIALNANLDGSKTTKTAEEFQRALDQLSSIVRSLKADLGVLLTPEGKKIFIVDDTGEILRRRHRPEHGYAPCAKVPQGRREEGAVAVPVVASPRH